MFKKAALGTLAVVSVGTFLFGRDAFSYLRTGCDSVREAVKGEVPIEFEIERARKMVAELMPEINRSKRVIIEEEVDIEQLRRAMDRKQHDLGDQEEAILSLTADLKSGQNELKYGGRIYKVSEVQKDLCERFNRFKVAQETVQREQDVLAAKEKAISAHREKLEGMLSARKDLEVELARLEARLRSIEAAQTISDLQIDDSQLTRCKSLIAELNKELDVREKMLDAEGNFTGLIPVETRNDVPVDIAEQVERYFGTGAESGPRPAEVATARQ